MRRSPRAERPGGRSASIVASLLAIVMVFGAAACHSSEEHESSSPAVRQAAVQSARQDESNRLRFAVGSMISPATTYSIYEDILRYIAEKAGRPFEFVQRRTYQEINELIISGQLDLAFICSGAFASLAPNTGVELIAVPIVNGVSTYHSLIITLSENDVTEFSQLRNRRFAFTDPLSNTGYFYPLARLGELGETPGAFFSQTTMTGSHDHSIAAVYRKLVDAAAVDSLVFHQVVTPQSRYFGKFSVIETSPGFPVPPFVAPTRVAPELRRSFRESLLQLHNSPEGRKLLDEIGVDRFVAGDRDSYKLITSYAERARRVLEQ